MISYIRCVPSEQTLKESVYYKNVSEFGLNTELGRLTVLCHTYHLN